ncbi:hypothetical protein Tco_1578949, partial [Tanacetum coccineum]
MLKQLELQPEYGGGSGSGGCWDDEPGDDEDGGEDDEDEDEDDADTRRCRPRMSPGKESHSSFSVPLIPGDMSPGKAIPSGFVPKDSGKCCSKHFKIPLRDINLATNNFPKFHRL